MKQLTTQLQRDELQSFIQNELLKRGYTAPIINFEEVEGRRGDHRIEFHTANFQTTPVIFKEIRVENFSSSLHEAELEIHTGEKVMITKFWITVHNSYMHFEGGTNGCKIFEVSGHFYKDNVFLNELTVR
jgi:hypothetical protein